MIRSPCEFYIKALLVDPEGYTTEQILDRLYAEGLDPIGVSYISAVRLNMAVTPTPFCPNDKTHRLSRRFLLAEGIYDYFHQEDAFKIARNMLKAPKVKEYLETMLILGVPAERIAVGARKHGAPYCTPEAVTMYAHYYWCMDMVDSVQARALLEARVYTYERSSDVGVKRLGEAVKKASWHDPRRAAAKMPSSPFSAVVAQIQMGYLPSAADKKKVLEVINTLLLARAYEKVLENGQDMPAQLQSLAGAIEAFDRVGEKLATPDSALREQLNSLAIATTTTSLPLIGTLTGGQHTKDLVLGTDATHASGEDDGTT